jgi:hypothetical protein
VIGAHGAVPIISLQTGARLDDGEAKAEEPVTSPLQLTFFDECLAFKPKQWLIKGAIARGESSSWFGPPKSIKSGLLLDASVHLAAGADEWRGYRIKERVGVVKFALERADLQRRRLSGYAKRDGYTNLPIAIAGDLINLLDPNCVELIVRTVRAAEARFGLPVGLVTIDTTAKGIAAGGGDEDKAKDQNALAANMKRLHEQLPGVHIASIGHTGKDESRGERGSNARLADVDSAIQLSGSDIRTATVIAANDQPSGPLTAFAMEEVILGQDEDRDDIKVGIVSREIFSCEPKAKKESKLRGNQQTMFSILHEAGNHGLSVEQWNEQAKAVGIGVTRKQDLYDIRVALKAKGLIIQNAAGWMVKQP